MGVKVRGLVADPNHDLLVFSVSPTAPVVPGCLIVACTCGWADSLPVRGGSEPMRRYREHLKTVAIVSAA